MPPVNVQVVLLALSHPAYNVDAACELKIISPQGPFQPERLRRFVLI